jgi:hypothetical protein
MNDLEQTPLEEWSGNESSADEISLVDLFVVLLRYRRLILVFALLGLAVSIGYYVIQRDEEDPKEETLKIERLYGGRITVAINPRMGRSGLERFPGWFNSEDLLNAALKEAGLGGSAGSRFTVAYNQNDGVDIVLKPGPGSTGQVEKLFSGLMGGAEAMAASHYAQYAADIISYFESLQDLGKDYSAQDYIRYQWARDLLSGRDTVLKALYAPSISSSKTESGASPQVLSLVIFFAFLFFAVFLAFVLNALKNIGADKEAMVKIRGALAKEKRNGA